MSPLWLQSASPSFFIAIAESAQFEWRMLWLSPFSLYCLSDRLDPFCLLDYCSAPFCVNDPNFCAGRAPGAVLP